MQLAICIVMVTIVAMVSYKVHAQNCGASSNRKFLKKNILILYHISWNLEMRY